METFNDFWSLLPIKDADVYFELQHYLNDPGCETEIMRLFKTTTYKFLLENLLEYPYPMCQIIRCFPSSVSTQIFYDALQRFNELPTCEFVERKSKLYSLLVNASITDKWLEKCEAYVFNTLLQRIDNDEFSELPFILLISELPLLKAYNAYMSRRCELNPYTTRSAFFMAITKKSHFLEPIVSDNGGDTPEPAAIQSFARLLRIVVQISNGNSRAPEYHRYDDILKRFDDEIDATQLSDNQLILYHEIQRILSLYQFVRMYRRYDYQCDSIAVRTFAAKYSILDFIYKFNDGYLLMQTSDYQSIRVQLVKNQTLNQLISPHCVASREKISEVNVFDQFYAVNALAEAMQANQYAKCYEDSIRVKCNEIKQIIDNMFDTLAFVETIESLFTLLFLRWENVNTNADSDNKLDPFLSLTSIHESDRSANYNDLDVPTRKLPKIINTKNGFVCSFVVLQTVLNILSSSMTNHRIEERDESLKERFHRVDDEIGNAKWRLALVDSFYSFMNFNQLSKSVKKLLTPHHMRSMNAKTVTSSSEDEDDASTKRSVRRKPRRRNSYRKRVQRESSNAQFAHSTEFEGNVIPFECSNISILRSGNYRDRKGGFINKMLGSFVDMVVICVSKGDLAEAKWIIQAQNLDGTLIAQELQFLEQFEELKTQLKDHLKTTPLCVSEEKLDSDYSVEEIRDLVVHGFESSQILTTLEHFITRNHIQQSREAKMLLERFSTNYPYLDLYRGSSLQGTIIVDYLISLTANADTCLNIVNMIPQLWDKNESIDSIHNQTGYYNSFRQIILALSLYNSKRDRAYGIHDFLANECCPFDCIELATKIKREDTFEKLKMVDMATLATISGLKENILNFDVFNRKNENLLSYVFTYSINMNRLINCKNSSQREMKYKSLQEVLEIDLFSLIGDIVFQENANISLYDIESIVCNLNTNLLHVITRNTCPIISMHNKFVSGPEDELKNVLEMLTNSEKKSNGMRKSQRKPYKIGKRDILDYTQQHNSLVAYLLSKIQNIDGVHIAEDDEYHCTLLENILQMEELNVRTASDEQINKMIAALSFDYFDVTILWALILRKDYLSALQFLQYSQEIHQKKLQTLFHEIKDALITEILSNKTEKDLEVYSLIEHIGNLKLMAATLFEHIQKISDEELASHLIRTILLHDQVNELSPEQLDRLKKYLSNIKLFAKIGRVLTHFPPHDSWTKIMEISRLAPENLLNSLIERNQFELCYEWIQVVPLQPKSLTKPKFIELFMDKIGDNRCSKNEYFIKMCKKLLENMFMHLDSKFLLKLQNRNLLQYLVDHLIASAPDNGVYRKYLITLKIFDVIDPEEMAELWDLVREPLLIIEQYLINSKFESLSTILEAIRPLIKSNKCQICINAQQNESLMELGKNFELYKQILGDSGLNRCNYVNYKNHLMSIECIDHLLRTYASKALDFRISNRLDHSDQPSKLKTTTSLDSLCGIFVMPCEPPPKENWVKDNEASFCMCCKRSVFTMLTRRHHCRRCGRVVCHSCSSKRLSIPKLYGDILVRVCDDCARKIHEAIKNTQNTLTGGFSALQEEPRCSGAVVPEVYEPQIENRIWTYRFSTNSKHNNLLRDDFSFKYAPSASLCLSILALHSPGIECSNFLFSYYRKFETLLKPLKTGLSNPEVDYTFVTRILYCLSFAAKMHGGDTDSTKVRDHAEIINSVVRQGCESLLPMESINMNSLRTLRDNLMVAEKWSLAIEISLKCGMQKTGIMAAWGIACIKAGCFETAREKIMHCLSQTTCDEDRQQIIEFLRMDDNVGKNLNKNYVFKSNNRLSKSQQLLLEILSILETTCHPLHSDVLHKASIISQSNRSLASLKLRRKQNIPIHEPAVNILNTLSNLRQISQGKYSIKTHRTIGLSNIISEKGNVLFAPDTEQHGPHSRFYSEAIYYLVSYGRHIDILRFLIKYKQIAKALKYTILLRIPTEQFIQAVVLPYLKNGRLNIVVQQMIDMDITSLLMWKEYIIQICLMLEKRHLLNSLYQIQLLLKDTVRASMTCVRFYTMGCTSYVDLRNNSYHLMDAQKHLKSELELCQWEEIKAQTKRIEDSVSLVMKIDSKSINNHINTIWLQNDSAKFLAACEENGKDTVNLIPKISLLPCTKIPTLFGSTQDKIIITALILICGTNIEEGFGLVYRIIQDMSLNADKIYAIATKFLSMNNRLHDVEKLVDCVKGNSTQTDKKLCDEILSLAVQTAYSSSTQGSPHQTKVAIENLIRLIDDIATQIDCYILSGQLKAAYLLAVQHKRIVDIRRILRHAEKTNQMQVRKLCERKLLAIDAQTDSN